MSMRKMYVDAVEGIAEARPAYREGGDGSEGSCDCVGAGIGALRRMGIPYDGLHGSNWAARHEAVELWEIDSVHQLQIGDNVLKAYEPGDAGWNLPARYGDDPDQRDYYHFGVVVSVNPLRILHMTSPTFKTDTVLGKWKYAFLWRQLAGADVEEGKEMAALWDAKVVLQSGWLNLRNGPGEMYRDIGDIPNGAIVEVLVEGEWPFVRFAGKTGYVMGGYLERIENELPEIAEPGKPEEEKDGESVTTLIGEDGQVIRLIGRWRAAQD